MEGAKGTISVIVITRNEEENISDCLRSVTWADEIIVVDSQSTDRTVELAGKYTQKVIVSKWQGYAEAKTLAMSYASSEWILWLDADERVPAELATEIQGIVRNGTGSHDAYEIARRAYFLGKWIKHSGWYPAYVVRLFRKAKAAFVPTRVHERLEISGVVGQLQNDLLHYTDTTVYHYFDKFNRYTTLAADDVKERGKRCSFVDLTVRPVFMFIKMYLLRRGFMDGMHGLVLAILSASYVFVKYAKLREQTA